MKISIDKAFFDSLVQTPSFSKRRKILFDAYKTLFLLPGYDRGRRSYSGGIETFTGGAGEMLIMSDDPEERRLLDFKDKEETIDPSFYQSKLKEEPKITANLSELILSFSPTKQDDFLTLLLQSGFSPAFCMFLDRLDQETRDYLGGSKRLPRTTVDFERAKGETRRIFSQTLARLGIERKEDALARALSRLEEEEPEKEKCEILAEAISEEEPLPEAPVEEVEVSKAEEKEIEETEEPKEQLPETTAEAKQIEEKPAPHPEEKKWERKRREPQTRFVKSKVKDFLPPEIEVKKPRPGTPPPAPKKEEPKRRLPKRKIDAAALERAILQSLAEAYREQVQKYSQVARAKPLNHVTLAEKEETVTYRNLDEAFKKIDSRIRKNGLKSMKGRWLILLATSVEEETADILESHYPGKVYYTDDLSKGKPDFAIIVKPAKGDEDEEQGTTFVKDKRASFTAPKEESAYSEDYLEDLDLYPFLDDEDEEEESPSLDSPYLPYEEEEEETPRYWHCYICGKKKSHTGTPSKIVTLSNGKTVYLCKKHKDAL